MATTTYHVALAIGRTEEGDLAVEDAVEAASPAVAVGRARQIASRTLRGLWLSNLIVFDSVRRAHPGRGGAASPV
jgi:hypothetical protein